MWKPLATPLAIAVFLVVLPDAAHADFSSSGCATCHGSPPSIANTVTDAPGACGTATYALGLGESWMSSQTAFLAQVHGRGSSCGVSQMSGLAGSDAAVLWAYMLSLRDGAVDSFSLSFSATAVGSSRDSSATFAVRNYRKVAMSYSVSATNDYSVVAHTAAGSGCTAGVVPAATDLNGAVCTVSVTIRFTPTVSGTRTGSATVDPGTNSGIDYQSRTVNFSANAYTPTPGISYTPSTLILTSRIGATKSDALTVTNPSGATANLILSGLSFTGTSGVFAHSGTCVVGGLGLSPGASCTVIVAYTATAAGAQNGGLTISHNAAGSPSTVTIVATGTQSLINPTSGMIDFGSLQEGAAATLNQVITNSGTAVLDFGAPLPIEPSAITGNAAADYTVSGCTSPVAANGGSCTLAITFTPSAVGPRQATLILTSDATNGPAVITLNANGTPIPGPHVSLTPAALEFGSQTIAVDYPARTLRVTNSGTLDLSIASITVAGLGFTDTSTTACPAVLAPGAGCDIAVTFAATAMTNYTGSVTVLSNAPESPNVVEITGVGTTATLPVLTYVPATSSVDFGDVVVGSISETQTVTLENQGPGSAFFTQLDIAGTAAGVFAIAGGTCAVNTELVEKARCAIVIQFAPDSTG